MNPQIDEEFTEFLDRTGLDYREFWNVFGDEIPQVENIKNVYGLMKTLKFDEQAVKENIALFAQNPENIRKTFRFLTKTKGMNKKQTLEVLSSYVESFAYLTKIMNISEKYALDYIEQSIDEIKEQTPEILENILYAIKH